MWLILLFFLLIRFTFYNLPISFAINQQSQNSVSITVSIEENRATIFGYTSPKSRVELSSPKVFTVTYSDQNGYFVFDKIILPKNPSDLCLVSFDNNQRSTSPICIAPPPIYKYHTNIGPILLPPTISIENDRINPNSTVITSGQAIPNSTVNVHFYKVNSSAISFPKQVEAYSLPPITATSDSLGNFNLNLPTAYSSNYRLYASAKFDDNYSPKSNTLIYFMPSFFSLFLQKYPFLYLLIPSFVVILNILSVYLYLKSDLRYLKSKIYLPSIQHYFPAEKKYYLTNIFNHHINKNKIIKNQ